MDTCPAAQVFVDKVHVDKYMGSHGQVHGFMWTSSWVHVDKYTGSRGQVHGYTWTSTWVLVPQLKCPWTKYTWTSTQVLVPQLKCPWTSTHGQVSLYWSCWTGTQVLVQ